MAETSQTLVFDTSFKANPDETVEVLPAVRRVTAPNGGPFTFTGTNSFVIGRQSVAVLDPGPDDPGHREALLRAIGGREVEAILLTHTHKDHSAGAAKLKAATGAPLWFGGAHRLSRPPRLLEINALARDCDWNLAPDRTLFDGEHIEVGGVGLVAVATPGHCANHVSYGIEGTEWLFTGDHIMGWNSTLVAVPDGSMADYLASLSKVLALPYTHYLPAHGGPIEDGPAYGRALLQHRRLRNSQIVDAVKGGVRRIGGLVDRIYPTLSGPTKFAARLTLKAHIEYLEKEGLVSVHRGLSGMRLFAP